MGRQSESMTAFDPDYPTPGALAYRDGFLAGARARGLGAIPPQMLSWAIDRAIVAQATSVRAGQVFADVYYEIQMQREPRGGYANPNAYLLAAYERKLKDGR